LPREGKFCPAVAANISTLRKRHGCFLEKILVKKRAYEKIKKERRSRAALHSVEDDLQPFWNSDKMVCGA
jgi:hypothetical protein